MSQETAPKTPSAMWDLLHVWFGIGSYDDIASTRPWHRERMVEVAKLKSLLKSRRASLAEVYIAARYARQHHKPIHATWQVFALIPEAMRDRYQAAAAARRETAHDDLGRAITEALEAGEPDWAERLMRAENPETVLAAWRAR